MFKSSKILGFFALVMAGVIGFAGAARAMDAKEESRLKLPEIRIQAERYVFGPGEKIVLRVSIDNSGDNDMKLFDGGVWDSAARRVAPAMTFALSREGRTEALNTQSGEKPVKGKKYFLLKPGEMSVCGLDLTSWCGRLEPGRYSFVVRRMVGASVADSNVFIFEVADKARAAEIEKELGLVRDFLRAKKERDLRASMSLDGVWVEVDKGRRMLYVPELASSLIKAKKLPRPNKALAGLVYLPAYDAVLLRENNNDSGELFFLRPEAGRLRVRSIRDLQ